MRAVPLSIVVLSLASACATRPPATVSRAIPESASSVSIRRDDNSATLLQGNSGLTEPTRLVVRSDAEWRDVWSKLVDHVSPVPEPPSIDFTKEMVVVASLGAKPTSGHMIRVARAGRMSGVTYVEVVSTSPGPRCKMPARPSAPADVVVMPKLDEPVTFVETYVVSAC
jgi:hypothetical protein